MRQPHGNGSSSNRYLSPLRYPGGKARMAPWLSRALGEAEVWCEPFAGGAGAALRVLTENWAEEAWLVEKNPCLAAFWRCVIEHNEWLASKIETTYPSLSDFYAAAETVRTCLGGECLEQRELAFATFILNRCSRSGLIRPNVGPIGGKAQAGRWKVDARFNSSGLAERIRRIGNLGSRLRIFADDGTSMIEALADSGIESEVFVFADPPYVEQGNHLYAASTITFGLPPRCVPAPRSGRSPTTLTRRCKHSTQASRLSSSTFRTRRIGRASTRNTSSALTVSSCPMATRWARVPPGTWPLRG